MNPPDPETELRSLWASQGVPQARQDECIAQITVAAQPGAWVGPFQIGGPVKEAASCRPATELFDTTDYSPLFTGIPVPATHTALPAHHTSFGQPAFFCFMCHGGGKLLLSKDGHRYCASCAIIVMRRR